MFSKNFWKATAERAVKTAAQTVLTVYLVGDVAFNVFDTDWLPMIGVALGGAVTSVVTSLASGGITKDGPGLSDAERLNPR